ncbi:ATP-grasp domain-containing protein, partial [Janibacter melonis]|uniref:ATP-grasp domain-containing protein n=2 Tax=Bacteria TaxID=2 RepID=UPI001CEF78BE
DKAIQQFMEAGDALGFYTELITKEDYRRLSEFDALFIRETTSVNHHTYRFARRAQSDGLVVIDDPVSILRCTNKVYLAELLTKAKVAIPKTMIIHRQN